jgi:parallel beta-helix repeat protein
MTGRIPAAIAALVIQVRRCIGGLILPGNGGHGGPETEEATVISFRLRSRSKIELVVVAVLVAALVVVLLARKPDKARAAALVAVTCGQTITVSTTLTNDLTNCPGNGLVIGHDSITVNLNGHTIDGTAAGGSFGVYVNTHKSVIVQGPGTITQFTYGVSISGGATNTVKSLRFTGNSTGIYVGSGSGNTITLNNIYSNDTGAFVYGASTKVTSNTFASNTASGLFVEGSALSSVITGNHALNNGYGIILNSPATGTTITSNVANGNSFDGIRSNSARVTLTTNTANYNGQLGLAAAPGTTDGNGNKAHDNGTAKQCVNVVCS